VVVKIILLSFCGSLLCLDRVFIQAMVSRPVVIAPFIGFLLGNPYVGLIIGALVELFWIDRIPVGTYVPPNDSIVAVLAISIVSLAGKKMTGISPELISLAILLSIPFGVIASKIEVLIIKSNDFLSDQALKDARNADMRAIERKNYLGLIKVFLFVFIYLLILLACLVPLTIWLYPRLNSSFISTLSLIYYFLPLLGIAVAINTIKLRGAIPIFCAIFLLTAIFLEFIHVR
jgi:PTS system mannose-specific IIC component